MSSLALCRGRLRAPSAHQKQLVGAGTSPAFSGPFPTRMPSGPASSPATCHQSPDWPPTLSSAANAWQSSGEKEGEGAST